MIARAGEEGSIAAPPATPPRRLLLAPPDSALQPRPGPAEPAGLAYTTTTMRTSLSMTGLDVDAAAALTCGPCPQRLGTFITQRLWTFIMQAGDRGRAGAPGWSELDPSSSLSSLRAGEASHPAPGSHTEGLLLQ